MAVVEFPLGTAEVQAPASGWSATAAMRVYFSLLFCLALSAFIFGVGNRFTANGLFNVPPSVDWLPPLSAQDWWAAFTLHQQDPAFSACGGTESLAEFKLLYWWEWSRRVSTAAAAVAAIMGFCGALLLSRFYVALPRFLTLGIAALAYGGVRVLVDLAVAHSDVISHFNVGQYRHGVDVAFATAIVAGILASAIVVPEPRRENRRVARSEWCWVIAIVLDIAFGALFAARDATAVWTTWPGYEGRVAPPLNELLSYSPVWLNVTFNQYMIQLLHRSLSAGIWIAALWQLVSMRRRQRPANLVVTRFLIVTGQMLTGIATLTLGAPPALSVTHQVGSIALLACSFVALMAVRTGARDADRATSAAAHVTHQGAA